MMATERSSESYDVAVVGGGQAGLAIGYFLKRQESQFVIFDAAVSIGAAWRARWDSLVLFTPAPL
jgi:putative flavoprotein involved in K+ transport